MSSPTQISTSLLPAKAQKAVDAGRFTDNADIFSLDIIRWCQEMTSEIECVQYKLEELQ